MTISHGSIKLLVLLKKFHGKKWRCVRVVSVAGFGVFEVRVIHFSEKFYVNVNCQ